MYSPAGERRARPAVPALDGAAFDVANAISAAGASQELADFVRLTSVQAYLEAGLQLERLAMIDREPEVVEMSKLRDGTWSSPLKRPGKILAVGLNIPTLVGTGVPLLRELPTRAPFWFYKPPCSVIGPGEPIVHPGEWHTSKLIPEPELALVIGRRCGPGIASPKAEEAASYVAGFTVCNDVSALDIEFERGGDPFAYNLSWGKSYPTFAPLGPWITLTGAVDPGALEVSMDVNGATVLTGNTSSYLWSAWELVEYFSAVTILEPGDVISCGNFSPTHVVWPGDEVAIHIEGVGTLANPVVSAVEETRFRIPEAAALEAARYCEAKGARR